MAREGLSSKPQGSGKSQEDTEKNRYGVTLTKQPNTKESDNSRTIQSASNHKFDINCDCESCMNKLTKNM